MTHTYIFVRTRGDAVAAVKECVRFNHLVFENYYDPPFLLRFKGGSRIFSNGFVARKNIADPIQVLAAIANPVFECAESWAILRPGEDFIERPEGGPISQFAWALKDKATVLAFLISQRHEFLTAAAFDGVRGNLSKSATDIAFQFRDGAALIAATAEPLTISVRRTERALNQFDDWLIESSEDDEYHTKDSESEYWFCAP